MPGMRFGHAINEQLHERREWLLQLGLTPGCAHDLAMHTLERPEFNLSDFKRYWQQLSFQLGPRRRDEVDAMVIRRMRELLHTQTLETNHSPPRDINKSSNGSDTPDSHCLRDAVDSPVHYEPDHYLDRRMTSTPVNELVTHCREAIISKINADPRIADDNYQAQHPNDCENFNSNSILDADQRDKEEKTQFMGYNNQQFNNNFGNVPYCQQFTEPTNNLYFNNKARELQHQSRYLNNNNQPFQNNNEPNVGRFDDDNYEDTKRNLNLYQFQRPQIPETETRMNTAEDAGNQYVIGNSRKRNQQNRLKRRYLKRLRKVFQIGNFHMPRIQHKSGALPQPEDDSYAIMFYRRTYSPIVGGKEHDSPALPVMAMPNFPTNPNRILAKRIRQELRNDWVVSYRSLKYNNWDVWWNDFKWCRPAIERQLEVFKGINLMDNSFLHCVMNYYKPQTVKKLLHLATLALQLNKTNYQLIIGTIFELTNKRFLEKLDYDEMGRLQDLIRYMPNHLWTYKMRSMVYLWTRYSEVRLTADSNTESGAKDLWATNTQWNSPLFHWLALQAYDELKRISRIEWPDHSKIFPPN